ncbi:hypothetical protein PaG_02036 [Moesziomyces aphidis]|uniref:Uncharacterized protein n=1 Tax=Moesziomyces aphidis TaxID=84754 RepID=W3VSH2_MOEAP|nr:hypothetical protein PaG_02036 [Moesziomyces aphidis]
MCLVEIKFVWRCTWLVLVAHQTSARRSSYPPPSFFFYRPIQHLARKEANTSTSSAGSSNGSTPIGPLPPLPLLASLPHRILSTPVIFTLLADPLAICATLGPAACTFSAWTSQSAALAASNDSPASSPALSSCLRASPKTRPDRGPRNFIWPRSPILAPSL